MKKFITLTDSDIFPDKESSSVSEWKDRKTVKVILTTDEDRIALVTNSIHGLYLLPGGGVDEGEEVFTAANRECQEEIGYTIINPEVFGYSEEWRARNGLRYDTVCVTASLGIKINKDLRTEDEKKNELKVEWFSITEDSKILKEQVTRRKKETVLFYNTAFNIIRDQIFLEKYIEKR